MTGYGRTPGRAVAGFTLLEMTTVLVLTAVLAAAIMLAAADTDTGLGEQTDMLKTRIRYAQARAMGSNQSFGISGSGGSYFLFAGTSTSARESFPNEADDAVTLPSGFSTTPFLISFNQWGEPFSDAAQTSALTTELRITVSGPDSESTTIAVTPVTGFTP